MKIKVTTNSSNISNKTFEVNMPLWNIKELRKTDDGYRFNVIDGTWDWFRVSEEDGKKIEDWIENSEFHLSCNV